MLGGYFLDDSRRCSQVKLGSAADFLLDISETDLSTLTASIKAPSGRDEPCLLKRLPNNHIGKPRPGWSGNSSSPTPSRPINQHVMEKPIGSHIGTKSKVMPVF